METETDIHLCTTHNNIWMYCPNDWTVEYTVPLKLNGTVGKSFYIFV